MIKSITKATPIATQGTSTPENDGTTVTTQAPAQIDKPVAYTQGSTPPSPPTNAPVVAVSNPLASNMGAIDLKALRLPTNYAATLGMTTGYTQISVGMPSKGTFIRVREGAENCYPALLYEDKRGMHGESYLAMPQVAADLEGMAHAVNLHYAICTDGVPFILPVTLPDESGEWNPWHKSRAECVELAKKRWLRFKPNKKSYEYVLGSPNKPDPEWPNITMEELITIAFKNKIITTVDHAIIRGLQGLD